LSWRAARQGVTGFWVAVPLPLLLESPHLVQSFKPEEIEMGARFLGLVVDTGHASWRNFTNLRDDVSYACASPDVKSAEDQEKLLAEAVRSITEVPARFMGLIKNVESSSLLAEGERADVVVLDDEGGVLQTWVGGEIVSTR